MKTRWQFILGLCSAISAAAQIVITPGESIFGPPLPSTMPTVLRNGQCPRCGHQMPAVTPANMDVLADHFWTRTSDGVAKLLRDCVKCHGAYWQRLEE